MFRYFLTNHQTKKTEEITQLLQEYRHEIMKIPSPVPHLITQLCRCKNGCGYIEYPLSNGGTWQTICPCAIRHHITNQCTRIANAPVIEADDAGKKRDTQSQ